MDRHPSLQFTTLCLVVLLPAASFAQWEPDSRLGLSAAADEYVDHLEPDIDSPFTLYVILTGLSETEPLTFDLQTVTWLVHTVCCGDSPVGVVSMVQAPGFVTEGDPYDVLETVTLDCHGGDTVLLATITFDWLLEGATEFLLSAGAVTAALDCEDDAHLLQTITVAITGQDPTPAESSSWSQIKALFASEEIPQ